MVVTILRNAFREILRIYTSANSVEILLTDRDCKLDPIRQALLVKSLPNLIGSHVLS